MSLLSVTVKKARYVAMQATQFNTYVTLKLQNVKSTTVTVKGPAPCWEQDFLFETNDINSGLLVEVWNKGVIWDRALGYHWLPLTTVAYANEDCGGRWVELEAQLVMRGGAVVGTAGVTGHALLLDCRFELPFDAEGAGAEAAAELQRKLDLLNGALDAERAEQARRQMQYVAHSGYSEDSDYTSDLNYPVGQHPNCSASQFRNAAPHSMHTPQRSLEVSRENSYERDEYQLHSDADPLYYNSRPRNTRNDWTYQGDLQAQASVESAVSWRTAADWTSGDEPRRPSLERQNTLYDDLGYGYEPYSSTNIGEHPHFSQQASYEEYFDSSSYPLHGSGCAASDERRQWDGGGLSVLQQQQYEDDYYEQLAAVQKSSRRRSSVVQLPQIPSTKYDAASFRYSDYNGMEPYRPRQRRTAASLPVTPSSTPRAGRALPLPPSAGSGTGSVGRSRRLPRVPHAPAAGAAHAKRNNRRVPYNLSVSLKTFPARNYSLDDGYEYQQQNYQQQDYQQTDNQHLDYQDANSYNSSYQDEDGMQPFFNETPHATPPALQKITNWTESNTTTPTTARAAVNYRFKFPTATQDATPTFPPSAAATAPCLPGVPAAAPAAGLPAPTPQPAHPDAAATVLAGAQSLGLLAAGGAKKFSGMFGSLFSAPAVSSAPTSLNLDASSQFTPAKVEPPLISSRPGATLPRAPSLRRQESLQRPPVQRLRSLPNAPDDDYYPEPPTEEYDQQRPDETDHSHVEKNEEEFFDQDYAKTESRRASPEVLHRKASQEALARSSPARSVAVNGFGSRKPSVDSYGSAAAERRTSTQLPVPEFHREDAKPPLPQVPTAEAEPIIDKNGRASAQERTSYHEEKTSYHEEQYHDDKQYSEEHEHYAEEAEEFHEEAEKFDREHDEFREGEETYGEGFQEPQPPPQAVFEEEQPKLTPRQLWHRAYNKIIRQLNIDANNAEKELKFVSVSNVTLRVTTVPTLVKLRS